MDSILARDIVIIALKAAHDTHEQLGIAGIKKSALNQHGEMAVHGDVACEKAVIGVCREHKLAINIHSEEHGLTSMYKPAIYTAVLDGIDGSRAYIESWGHGMYSTMFAIFDGTDPRYGDYLAGGMMFHATKRLYYASKGQGALVRDLETGADTRIHCAASPATLNEAAICMDNPSDPAYAGILTPVLNRFPESQTVKRPRGRSESWMEIASGVAHGTIEGTGKGNLEIAVAYPLIVEAGGVVVDSAGKSIGEQKYLSFGQQKGKHQLIIGACSQDMADMIIDSVVK